MRTLEGSPLRKMLVVSAFPKVYPACLAYHSKLAMYWAILGQCILHFSRAILPHCCLLGSWNWASNSSRNWVQMMGKLSWIQLSLSIHILMSLTHPATSSPLIRVRVKVTFLIGESNPAMSSLTWKYALTSLIKLSAFIWSLVNSQGSCPITLMSAAAGTTAWPCPTGAGWLAGGPPPLPPPLPPPPLPPLPPG